MVIPITPRTKEVWRMVPYGDYLRLNQHTTAALKLPHNNANTTEIGVYCDIYTGAARSSLNSQP